jgi:serine protease Do
VFEEEASVKHRVKIAFLMAACACLGEQATALRADDSFADVADQVNQRVVKLFGSGGYQGLVSYGSGILVSPEGHVLTVASHILLTDELRVHLWDGRRLQAQVLVVEPELDAALLKINGVDHLPYFDVGQSAAGPLAKAGEWVLAFSNEFQIATRDEPVSVQHGVIAAYAKLRGRRGIFEAPYTGDVYVVDAVTNNPGAAGGALTDRRGRLLGVIGKELRNTLSDTWVNYAVPIQMLATFVDKAKKGDYKPIIRSEVPPGIPGYHGIVMVPNVVERTPPFIEEVILGSPAARAGLRPDDLVVFAQGEQIASVKAFRDVMGRARPGTVVKMEVRRADKAVGGGERLIAVEMTLEEPLAKKK